MKIPCGSCPWRKTTRTTDIPGGGMDHEKAQEAVDGLIVMACHLDNQQHPGCAGYVATYGKASAGIRFAIHVGILDLADYGTGGAALHEDMGALLAAHPHRR